MSRSIFVQGIKPADEKFRSMFQIYQACEKESVSIPKEVLDFFNHDTPDCDGMVVQLSLDGHASVSEYSDNHSEGFQVDLRALPPDIKIIRFVNSY